MTKQEAIDLVNKRGSELQNLPENFKDDKDIVMAAISNSSDAFEYASDRLRSDRECTILALKVFYLGQEGIFCNNLQYVSSEDLKNDKEILKIAAAGHDQAIMHFPEKWKNDKELLEIILSKKIDELAFSCFPESYRDDKEIAIKAINDAPYCFQYLTERLRDDEEIVMQAINRETCCYQYISERLKDVKEIAMQVLKIKDNSRVMLSDLSERLKKDKEIALIAIENRSDDYRYIDEKWFNDVDFINACLKDKENFWGSAYRAFGLKFKKDRVVTLKMSKGINFPLEAAPEEFKNDKEIVLNAVKVEPNNFKHIFPELLKDINFVKELYTANNLILAYMSDDLKNQIFTSRINTELHHGKRVLMELVLDDGYVQDHQRKAQNVQVEKDGKTLLKINNFPIITYEDDGPVGSYLSLRALNNIVLAGSFVFYKLENSGRETYTSLYNGNNSQLNDDFLKHKVYLLNINDEETKEIDFSELETIGTLIYFGREENLVNGISIFNSTNKYSEALTILNQKEIFGTPSFERKGENELKVLKNEANEINGAARVYIEGLGWRWLLPNENGAKASLDVLKKTTLVDDINWIKGQLDETAIIMAAEKGYIEVVKGLIDLGTNVNIKTDKSTALIDASWKSHSEIVKLLIVAGADVNMQNKSGYTALICAATNSNFEILKLLIEAGADVNMNNTFGETALIFASNRSNQKIVQLLIEAGADVNVITNNNNTPLSLAVSQGYVEIIKLLINHPDINYDNFNSESFSSNSNETLAIIFREKGDYLSAIQYFEIGFKKERNGRFQLQIGECYELLNDKENALKSYISCAEVRMERIGKDDNRTIEMINKVNLLAKELNKENEMPEWIKKS